jgi:hypothetical protein
LASTVAPFGVSGQVSTPVAERRPASVSIGPALRVDPGQPAGVFGRLVLLVADCRSEVEDLRYFRTSPPIVNWMPAGEKK